MRYEMKAFSCFVSYIGHGISILASRNRGYPIGRCVPRGSTLRHRNPGQRRTLSFRYGVTLQPPRHANPLSRLLMIVVMLRCEATNNLFQLHEFGEQLVRFFRIEPDGSDLVLEGVPDVPSIVVQQERCPARDGFRHLLFGWC